MEIVKGIRWYGWGIHRSKEDKTKCIEEVTHPIGTVISHYEQCSRPRRYGPGKLYCKQHDPKAVEKRKAIRQAQYEEESRVWNIEREDRLVGAFLRKTNIEKYKRLLSKSKK